MVLKEARALPLAEQIELCRNLWEEIVESKELTPGEAELIDRRLQDPRGFGTGRACPPADPDRETVRPPDDDV